MKEPYYMAYEKRYQTVFSAGANSTAIPHSVSIYVRKGK